MVYFVIALLLIVNRLSFDLEMSESKALVIGWWQRPQPPWGLSWQCTSSSCPTQHLPLYSHRYTQRFFPCNAVSKKRLLNMLDSILIKRRCTFVGKQQLCHTPFWPEFSLWLSPLLYYYTIYRFTCYLRYYCFCIERLSSNVSQCFQLQVQIN